MMSSVEGERVMADSKATQMCRICKSFLAHPHDPSRGWCRFMPPQVLLRAPLGSSTRYDAQSHWPEVNDTDWCAQWQHE